LWRRRVCVQVIPFSKLVRAQVRSAFCCLCQFFCCVVVFDNLTCIAFPTKRSFSCHLSRYIASFLQNAHSHATFLDTLHTRQPHYEIAWDGEESDCSGVRSTHGCGYV
jgi:hypothetical protein